MRINASEAAKLLAAAIFTTAGASGCVKFSSPTDNGPADSTALRIEFPTPIVSPATKADADNSATYPTESSFGVYGLWYPDESSFTGWESTAGSAIHIDGDEFFYNRGIGTPDKGGSWISDPAHYWLPKGRMAFAAWSPFSIKESTDEVLSYGAKGLTIGSFDTGNGDRDLMYSERVYDKTSSRGSNPTYDGIDIVFHHALAALHFHTEDEADRSSGLEKDSGDSDATARAVTKVTLTGIELWGFDRKGNFCENVDETSPLKYVSSPQWSDVGTRYTEDNPLVMKIDDNMNAYIIPQAIPLEAKIRIHYTVKIGDSPALPSVSDALSLSGNKISGTDEVLASWDMAKRYIYHITITSAVMIRFNVDITPWHDNADTGDAGNTGDTIKD